VAELREDKDDVEEKSENFVLSRAVAIGNRSVAPGSVSEGFEGTREEQ